MAKIEGYYEAAMQEWLAARPQIIQDMAKRTPPDRLYRLKYENGEDGPRVYIHSYDEDGTLSVTVSGQYNLLMFERHVFGIKPQDLEECDLPSPGEPLGAALVEEEDIHAYLDGLRAKEAGDE